MFLEFKTYRFAAPRQQERSLHRISHEIPPINASINYVARVGERALKARGRDTLLCLPIPTFISRCIRAAILSLSTDFRVPREAVNESSVIRSDIFNGESRRRCQQELEVFRVPYKFAISQSLPADV